MEIIECVPNISEGRDLKKINAIADVVKLVQGVQLLDVDPGYDTNRTVITFAGPPQSVIDAAFLLVQKAAELIDMQQHKGEHPRFGATDVCPLIPISGITLDKTAHYAQKLGKKIGREIQIPVYLYERAAQSKNRQNLALCRSGEYEGLEQKLKDPKWKPDFGPSDFKIAKKTGAIAVGARDFLVAYNINLNTTSTRRANAIAFDVREAGRVKREGHPLTGKILRKKNGEPLKKPGSLKHVKAIGWFIEEYGIAQISMNLTNINVTPVHVAFDEVCKKATQRGIRVTGSELVGLIPLKCMLAAADYFLEKQQRSLGISEREKIKIAVKSLGLDDLKPFIPEEKIIEYKLKASTSSKLIDQNLYSFSHQTASESPAPGGGSVSAYIGALGAALSAMVANISAHKRGWDEQWNFYSNWAKKACEIQDELLGLVDEDTHAFDAIMSCFSMPKNSKKEIQDRKKALQKATKKASEVPYQVMTSSFKAFEIAKQMAQKGLQASVSDAGVAALALRTSIYGAYLNVIINLQGIEDEKFKKSLKKKAKSLLKKACQEEKDIVKIVTAKIEG